MRRAPRAGFAAAGLLLLIAAAAGCGTHPHRLLWTGIDADARRAEFAKTSVPAALRKLGPLPPIAVHFSVARATTETAAAEARAAGDPIPFDGRVIGDELARLLESTGAFKSVIRIGDEAAEDLISAKEAARGKGASFLIEAIAGPPALRRVDRPFFVPLVVWLAGASASFWYHDQVFELTFDLRLRVHDLNTNQDLPERPLEPARASDTLSFHERTSNPFVYLLPNVFPVMYCPIDEDKIGRSLAATALEPPIAQFLGHLAETFKGAVYTFRRQVKPGGPSVEVIYPPAEPTPVFLLADKVRYSMVAVAPSGAAIREVRLNGVPIFPMHAEVGTVSRVRVPIEEVAPVGAGVPLLLEVTDVNGKKTTCQVSPLKRT
jgi:hypothetical protein